jgi:hypothetical protein
MKRITINPAFSPKGTKSIVHSDCLMVSATDEYHRLKDPTPKSDLIPSGSLPLAP